MEDAGEHDRGEVVEIAEVDGGAGEEEQDAEGRGLGERVEPGEDVSQSDDADRGEQYEDSAEQREELRRSRSALDVAGDHAVADRSDQGDGDERREERADAGVGGLGRDGRPCRR